MSSLTEDSTEANAINVLFVPTFEALARTAPWNCLRKQQILSLLAAAAGTPENPNGTTLPLPPGPYLYMYSLPNDCLDMRYILPTFPNSVGVGTAPPTTASLLASTQYTSPGQIPFEVAYSIDPLNNPIQVILTNQSQAQAVYTVNQPNPTIWDSLFQAAYVASLAAFLVPALNLNISLLDRTIKLAEASIAQARIRDGDEGVVSQNRNADWMTARNAGGRSNWPTSGFSPMYGLYSNMPW